jgi:hypothetical protein
VDANSFDSIFIPDKQTKKPKQKSDPFKELMGLNLSMPLNPPATLKQSEFDFTKLEAKPFSITASAPIITDNSSPAYTKSAANEWASQDIVTLSSVDHLLDKITGIETPMETSLIISNNDDKQSSLEVSDNLSNAPVEFPLAEPSTDIPTEKTFEYNTNRQLTDSWDKPNFNPDSSTCTLEPEINAWNQTSLNFKNEWSDA